MDAVRAMETLWFTSTAAEKCGDRAKQQAVLEKIIAIVEYDSRDGSSRVPRGFRGVPNAWSGIAAIRLAAQDLAGASKAVAAGIEAASKLRPRYIADNKQPQDAMSKHDHGLVVLMSALPQLYELEGLIAAAEKSRVGALQAVQAAKETYYETVTKVFPKWPRRDQATAALQFGLMLASLRFAADRPLPTPEPIVNASHDTGGWGEMVVQRDTGASCEIDVVTCVDDKEEFLRRYVDGNRPVLLRGFLHNAPKCAGIPKTESHELWPWPVLETWKRDMLYKTHGHLTVPMRRSSQTANNYKNYDKNDLGSGVAANLTLLSAFMDEIQSHSGVRSVHSDPPYLFEPVVLPNTRGTEYSTVLPLFDDKDRFASFDVTKTTANQIFIGAQNSVSFASGVELLMQQPRHSRTALMHVPTVHSGVIVAPACAGIQCAGVRSSALVLSTAVQHRSA